MLTIKDSAGGGTVKGGNAECGGAVSVQKNATLNIEGGTFTVVKNESAGDGPVSFGNVTLMDGATLVVPASGIRVAKLATSGSVTISGGRVTVANGQDRSTINLPGITLTDGAELEFVVDESAGEYGIRDKSVKKMTAIILGFKISKAQQLSNWEAETLSEAQQAYAATDAWVCRQMYIKLLSSEKNPLTPEQMLPNPPKNTEKNDKDHIKEG